MHAVILAGGKGTRLKPYTTILPKPLMPISDMPILEVVLRQLKAAGFSKVTLAVGHLAELLEAFFKDGSRLGLEISYSREEEPLGTVGPLKLIDDLPDVFLMMNGDVLTTIDYRSFMDFHLSNSALVTIATYKRQVKIDFGVIQAEPDDVLSSYTEKPHLDYTVSMGIYAFRAKALDYVPDNQHFDFPSLIQLLLKTGEKIATFPFDGYWMDIGRPDDYVKAAEEFDRKKDQFLPEI